jgi:hypothetical protein
MNCATPLAPRPCESVSCERDVFVSLSFRVRGADVNTGAVNHSVDGSSPNRGGTRSCDLPAEPAANTASPIGH